jgi:hypothetical protein
MLDSLELCTVSAVGTVLWGARRRVQAERTAAGAAASRVRVDRAAHRAGRSGRGGPHSHARTHTHARARMRARTRTHTPPLHARTHRGFSFLSSRGAAPSCRHCTAQHGTAQCGAQVWRLLEMTDARVLVRLLRVLPHTIALRLPHPSAIGNVRALAPARRAHPTNANMRRCSETAMQTCGATARQQYNVRSNNEAAMQRSARLRHSAGAHARPHKLRLGSARRQNGSADTPTRIHPLRRPARRVRFASDPQRHCGRAALRVALAASRPAFALARLTAVVARCDSRVAVGCAAAVAGRHGVAAAPSRALGVVLAGGAAAAGT